MSASLQRRIERLEQQRAAEQTPPWVPIEMWEQDRHDSNLRHGPGGRTLNRAEFEAYAAARGRTIEVLRGDE